MRKRYVVFVSGAVAAAGLFFISQVLWPRTVASPQHADKAPSVGAPRALFKETTHDFGVLDPTERCRHLFIVRNEGTSPLKIAKAGTSCKCTVSMLPKGEIPPGMGGPVEIESKIDQAHGEFRHTAAFLTNDPKMPQFELTIKGEVRSYLAASQPCIQLTDLPRGKPAKASTIVFSQVWNAFSLKDVKSSIEGVTWDFQPAPTEKLREWEARSGYIATFHLPPKAVLKSFLGSVEAVAESPDQPQHTRTIRLAIAGEVPAVRSVYGPQVDDEGVVTIGALKPGEGAAVRLLLKVRGEHRAIQVQTIEKSPAFLNVSLAPIASDQAESGLYRIVLEVPRDAPACNYMRSETMGDIRILTDHPEMPEIVRLKVAFAVISG